MYCETLAVGLWEEHYKGGHEIFAALHALEKPEMKKIETPDEVYNVFSWSWIDYDTPKMKEFLDCLSKIRHSMVIVFEDGSLFTDNKTDDDYGCDEEFYELLTPKISIQIFDSPYEDWE